MKMRLARSVPAGVLIQLFIEMNFTPIKIDYPGGIIDAEFSEQSDMVGVEETWGKYKQKYYDSGGMVFWGNTIKTRSRLSSADLTHLRGGGLPPKSQPGTLEFWRIPEIDSGKVPYVFAQLGFFDPKEEALNILAGNAFSSLHQMAKIYYMFISRTQLVAYMGALHGHEKNVRSVLSEMHKEMSHHGYGFPPGFADNAVKHSFFSITRRGT